MIPSCRRFLLPEYLPYAGIFHERGQPGLATHSSVNRVLAGKEMFLWIMKIWRGREPGKAFPSFTYIDLTASCHLDKNSVLRCTQFLTSNQETARLKKAVSLAYSYFLQTSFKSRPLPTPHPFIETIFFLNLAIRFWLLNDSSVLFKFQLVRYSWARSCDLIRGLMHTSPTLCYWQHMVFPGTVESSKKGGETHRAGWEISTEQKWAG